MWTAQFLVFVWASISVSALKLPTYIKACSRNDPQLNECVVKQGIAAIPNFIHGDTKYRVPNLDPLDIEELSVRQGTRQVGLNLVIRQCKLHGLSNAVFTKARMDMKKRHVEWDFINTKGLQILGTYNISGQVLILPIIGSGDANITITGLTITYKYDFDLVKKNDGKEYMNLTTSELLFDIGYAYFHLDNLFNGDKLLGDNMNIFLNENWKDLVKEFGPAVGSALGEVFRRLLTNIHGLVPYDVVYPVT
ncbi:protein takeout-like [Homalodisca vitripennis]|uniref:protein takeout-like n=1 Tax=Homalodisca vitripennis TaxID=197043 RepID=UPI001EEC5FC2|nr:protein takeout-like [Homalodisca vitripennis]